MSTYAIGDIQGCFGALQQLLQAIAFQPRTDRLWLVGDLVNRGPDSLAVLRWARDLGDRVTVVLGNHDLHLLAVAAGAGKLHRQDTLQPILDAPDCDELLAWLAHRPLLHRQDDWVMVHAGLLPQWTVDTAESLAQEVSTILAGPQRTEFFRHMYGNQPMMWSDTLTGWDRLRLITNAMTRMRLVTRDGALDLQFKGELEQAPADLLAWFDHPQRRSRGQPIVCGHWSALGLRLSADLLALDSGCLWGGQLSALRLEDRQLRQISCRELPGTTSWR